MRQAVSHPFYSVLTALLDGFLIAALVEQIFWQGDSSTFLFSAGALYFVVCLLEPLRAAKLAAVILVICGGSLALLGVFRSSPIEKLVWWGAGIFILSVNYRASRVKTLSLAPPLFLVLLYCVLLWFGAAASSGEREFQMLAGESSITNALPDLLASAALFFISVSFIWKATRTLYFAAGFLLAAISFCMMLPLIAQLPSESLTYSRSSIEGVALHSLTLLLVIFRFAAAVPVRGSWFFLPRSVDLLILAVPVLAVATSAGYAGYLIRTDPLKPLMPYPISEHFLVPLFTAEDPRFFTHNGVDYQRLRKVTRETMERGVIKRGASTLPMQLAKVAYLGHQKTFVRKFNQIVMGYILELQYSKQELLIQYVESIPYAPGIKGLQNASRHFFGIEPAALNRRQALQLVLSIYNPVEYHLGMEQEPRVIEARRAILLARAKAFASVLVPQIRKRRLSTLDTTLGAKSEQ
ncbi:MAG: transglycosylase domain-containing protein [Deltaproteobacteria bacterium]|nr:transglycosylase domain-containing protein [Deltaproteobacteria bacterium]